MIMKAYFLNVQLLVPISKLWLAKSVNMQSFSTPFDVFKRFWLFDTEV